MKRRAPAPVGLDAWKTVELFRAAHLATQRCDWAERDRLLAEIRRRSARKRLEARD